MLSAGRLSHGGAGGDQNQVRILQTRRLVVEVRKPGRNAGDIAIGLGGGNDLVHCIQDHIPNGHIVPRIVLLGQPEHAVLGPLHELPCRLLLGIGVVCDLLVRADQGPQHCLLGHDPAVALDVRRGRHLGDQTADRLGAVGLRREVLLPQGVLERHDVDGHALLIELDDRLKHDAVLPVVEVLWL